MLYFWWINIKFDKKRWFIATFQAYLLIEFKVESLLWMILSLISHICLSISLCGYKEPACQCRRHKRPWYDPWVGKIPWRRAWHPTPVFLPGESHGQRSLVGFRPWVAKSWAWLRPLSTYTYTHTHTHAHTYTNTHIHTYPSRQSQKSNLKPVRFILLFCTLKVQGFH